MIVRGISGFNLVKRILIMNPKDLKGPQLRAYNFVYALKELEDTYEIDIEHADLCMILHDRKTKKPLATLFEDELELDFDTEAEDH